jgi:hypothetical protein
MRKIFILILISLSLLHAFDDESLNNSDPGETIAKVDQITTATSWNGSGKIVTSFFTRDYHDYFRFTPSVKGKYIIKLTSDDALDMKAGRTFGHQEFYRLDNRQKSKTATITVDAKETVYLTIFDGSWSYGTRNYTLDISFIPQTKISVSDANITEGNKGLKKLSFTIMLDHANNQNDITVDYQTRNGTAEDENGNHDYLRKSGTVTIPKGATSATVDIDVDGDFQDESDETLYLLLSNPTYATIADANATGTILDDDDYDTSNHYSCETQAYIYSSPQVYKNGTWYFDQPTDVRTIDLVTSQDKLLQKSFYPYNINAIGYSVRDNFIWGFDINKHLLTRTDVNNNTLTFKVDGLPDYSFHIGDVSPDGILCVASAYLKSVDGVESNGIKRIYRVDVDPNSHTFRKMLPPVELSEQNLYSADWAFHPKDGQLYMVSRYDYDLIKINPETGKVTHMGALLPYNPYDRGSHVQFFDRDGYFYFYAEEEFYRVDITDPANPSLKVIHYTHLPLSANGDAARCAYAPMQNSFDIADVAQKEGDSGTTDMPFIFRLDSPVGAGGIDVDYDTFALSATENVDYIPVHNTIHLPAGSRGATLNVPIMGDTLVEANETLGMHLSSPDFSTESNATGTIINDDRNMIVFNAATNGSPLNDGNITTQIVNKNFTVTLSATDLNTHAPVADVNITRVDLVKTDGTKLRTLYNGSVTTDTNGLVTLTLTVPDAHRATTLQIYGNYHGIAYQNNASDDFAIRPDHFTLSLPANNVAGQKITLRAEARDADNHPAPAYNEAIHTSFDINYTEAKPACTLGTIDLNSMTFANGVASRDINYSETGNIDFEISEIKGSEFAKIDADDTPDSARYITSDRLSSVTFKPAKLKITDWSLTTPSIGFVYYADMPSIDKMAAQLDIKLRVEDQNGNLLQNFRSGCYATPAHIAVHFKTTGKPSQTDLLIWQDTKTGNDNAGNELPVNGSGTSQSFLYDVDPGSFTGGATTEHIRINFKRDAHIAKEPLRLTITDINASTDDGLSTSLTKTANVDFYYGRLHSPEQIGVGETLKVKLYHEVYCKSCNRKTLFTIAGGAESKDTVYWYIVNNSNDGISGFDHVNGTHKIFSNITNDPDTISATTGPAFESDGIENVTFHVTNLPFRDRILYKPVPWLYYDPFGNSGYSSFDIGLSPNPRSWAGQGKLGKTVDLNINTRRDAHRQIDW